MPTAAHSSRTVHVHGAEVSTDQAQLWDYAEVLVALLAVVVFVAAAWAVASPGADADLAVPAPGAAATGRFEVAADRETRTIVQPDPDGPSEVAVVRRGADFAQPLSPLPADPLGTAATEAAASAPLT